MQGTWGSGGEKPLLGLILFFRAKLSEEVCLVLLLVLLQLSKRGLGFSRALPWGLATSGTAGC